MFGDQRSKQIDVLRLKALNKRLWAQHPEKETVTVDLKVKYAEVNGEEQVKYTLGFLDRRKYLVLYNLRLPDQFGHFQTDFLVLTERVAIAIEVKNWQGTVIFGENGQVTQITPDGLEKGYKNPVDQVKTQSYRLQQWLLRNNFPTIPIEHLVVISFPKTIIKPASENVSIPHEVIHNQELIFRVQDIVSTYEKSCVTKTQVSKLAKMLVEAHEPPENVLDKFNIKLSGLIKGVFCPECGAVPMIRIKRKWHCNHCKYESKDAHLYALFEYHLLFGEWITNKEAREFLQTSSPSIVKRILKQVCMEEIGTNRWRKYKLDYRKLKPGNPDRGRRKRVEV